MVGKTLLHYEIRAQIGRGGMGEVFAAHDTKLGRDVALKILPAELTGDPEREARFHREARALASLQHPNVASVYGFEEADGIRFLVMELVSGTELTTRMAAGALPADEVRRLARQLAAGLEAAHESGIVHRDLKPANVMVSDDGEVKILDFGLAQAWLGDSPNQSESSAMPTITAAMTQVGAILGTAAYMSPEQARGVNVDRRTDIWAFGVILFEMLTGEQLFQGETVSDTLAAVLRKDPEWDRLPVDEAPELCRLVERCLERNPKQRLRDIGEARIFLQDGGESGTNLSFSMLGARQAVVEVERRRPVWVLVAIAAAALLVGTGLGWKVLSRPAPAPVIHAMVPPPPGGEYALEQSAPGAVAVSPDGTMIAYCARVDGAKRLMLRRLDQGEAVALSGTEEAAYPFWSADSRSIGFFIVQDQKLRKVAVSGGPPVTLCAASNGKGGSWNADGEIIFAASAGSGISVVPESGGDPRELTKTGNGYDSHRHPRFLPDGRHFLYTARTSSGGDANAVFLASLDTTFTPRQIATSDSDADYGSGHLLTVREGVLMATPFTPDMEKITTTGTPIVENVLTLEGAALSVFSPAASGMLAYQTGTAAGGEKQLYWRDRETGALVEVGEPGLLSHPSISPDGTKALVEMDSESDSGIDLWLVELDTGLRTRFTFAAGDEIRPVWTPDGSRVIYQAGPAGAFQLIEQPVEGQGGAAILFESKDEVGPTDVSPDGRHLLFNRTPEGSDVFSMWRLDLTGAEPDPVEVYSLPDQNSGGGTYSPDGRWIAFHHITPQGLDVFVIPAAGGARKWQISTDGRVYPIWAAGGTELWTVGFDGELLVFTVDGSGDTFRVRGSSTSLRVEGPTYDGNTYDLDPNGGRLLDAADNQAVRSESSLIQFVTDWQRGLMR